MNPICVLMITMLFGQEPQQPAPQAPTFDPGEAQRRVQEEMQRREQERRDEAAPVMKHDPTFDLHSVPMERWLEMGEEVTQIPWKLDVKDSALSMDQQLEVAFVAKIQAKDLNKLGGVPELVFMSGVAGPDRKWFVGPKVVRYTVRNEFPPDVELRFSDAVLAQPGKYVLWAALYDVQTGKHNVTKRRIQVSSPDKDPLPNAGKNLPIAHLSETSDREGDSVLEAYSGLVLPVANKRGLEINIVSILSPPEQWSARQDVIRNHRVRTFAALNTVSQLELAQGSISMTGFDILHQKTLFEQKDIRRLNSAGLAQALFATDTDTVNVATLQPDRGPASFLRESLGGMIVRPGDSPRVFIMVSSSTVFQKTQELKEVSVTGDCGCRAYHLRLRHTMNDVFDDIGKVLKPLRPATFTITNGRDLRKALAEIIKDLENL
jgi:hypothetical protein